MGGTYTWAAATAACEGSSYANFTDWRLPNVRELMSIVNYQNFSPAINSTYFPGTVSSGYWSSSTYASDTSYAWFVIFNDGGVYVNSKSVNHYVRCVRAGP